MKKYDVYGIGNALVDLEFEVTPDFLEKMNIEKGFMTLVGEDRQVELIDAVEGARHKRKCGGSAANSIIAVSQFGGKSFYSCKVADDEMGDFYMKDLSLNGVDSNLQNQMRQSGTTGKCMVFVTADADRTMNTYLGITEDFSEKELVPQSLSESKYLYIEGYLVTSETGKAAALKAKEMAKVNDVKVALTFSDPSMPTYFKEGLEVMVGDGVDLLFCNEEEALAFTGEKEFSDAFERLKKVAKSIAITQGPRGAILWDGEKEIDVVANTVEAIDTNGAGDLFAGTFLYGLTNGLSYHESGKLACAAASKVVTQFGPRLSKEQAIEIKSQVLK